MAQLPLILRPEKPGDAEAIERLHERAFGPGRFARTAYRIREGAPPRLDLSFTALVGSLLVGDEPYYGRFGFTRVPPGRLVLPGPVDPNRLLAAELVDGALARAQGAVRPAPMYP